MNSYIDMLKSKTGRRFLGIGMVIISFLLAWNSLLAFAIILGVAYAVFELMWCKDLTWETTKETRFWLSMVLVAIAIPFANQQFSFGKEGNIRIWHTYKSMILTFTIPLIIYYAVIDWLKSRNKKISPAFSVLPAVALVILGFFALCSYFDFGRYAEIPFYINKHDFFHYYMGPKYSKEVGYLHLYPCALIVDRENEPKFKNKSIRDQEDYSFTNVETILKDTDKYKAMFSEERWKEFEKDILFFRTLMGDKRWQKALRDKGYNATPVWNLPARIMTNLIPTNPNMEEESDRKCLRIKGKRCLLREEKLGAFTRSLLMLDLTLIIIMFILVYWAFDWRTTLLAIIFFGTNFMMNETHIKGSILRLDWVTFLVMSTCLIKMGRYKISGALMGYAAMSRIFPAVFVFGIAIKALVDFIKSLIEKGFFKTPNLTNLFDSIKQSRKYFEFFVAFVIILTTMFTISVTADGGIAKWKKYKELISMHNRDIVGVRAGYKYIFMNNKETRGGNYKQKMKDYFDNNQSKWHAILAVILLISAFLVVKLEDYEAIPYCFVLAFFMAAPTFYYYVMLIVPLLFFAPKLKLPNRAMGLILLFSFSILGYIMFVENLLFNHKGIKLNFALFYWNSIMYFILAIYIMICAAMILISSLIKKKDNKEVELETT